MNRIKKIGLIILSSFVAISGLVVSLSIFSPQLIHRVIQKKTFYDLGLRTNTIHIENDYLEYVEGGKGPTVLLVHGFQAEKASWTTYIKKLIGKYHVIAIDLPGHGGSSLPESLKFNLQSVADHIEKFVHKLDLKKFHLVGSSMGGGLCAIYASKYPEHLLSLSLINPLGVGFDEKSEFFALVDQGKNLFFPESIADLDELSHYLTGRALKMGTFSKHCLLSYMTQKRPFYERAFKDLWTSVPLDETLRKIQTRTLLIYGKQDRLLHPSSYKKYAENLPNPKVCELPKGTHVFTNEELDKSITQLETFLEESVR